jgi:predicted nucleic acid-binding protein
VTVILDSGPVVALFDRDDPNHERTAAWVLRLDEDLVTTPLAISEMDRLVTIRGGDRGRAALRRDLDAGAYTVRWWADGLAETLEIAHRHDDADLTDASLVALAGLLRTNRIATFDERFRSMTTPRGDAFVLLPADA